jgi:hypothetical protein
MIKITNISEDDFLSYSKFAISRLSETKPQSYKQMLINIASWMVIGFVLMYLFKKNSLDLPSFHWPTALLIAVPFLFLIGVFFYNLKNIQKKLLPNSNGLMIGESKIEFCDKGITDTTSLGVSFYKWEAVEDVVENNGAVYVFLDKMLAEIFPASTFKDSGERTELIDYVKNKMHNKSLHQTS